MMASIIKYILLASAVVVLIIGLTHGKKMDRCAIARELKKHGFNQDLKEWVCLVEHESSGNTAARGPANSDGSHDYGLFQINDRYWCEHGRKGKECNIDCNSLLDDNIADDVKCVRKIFSIHGFEGWYAWVRKCKGGRAPSVSHC